MKFLIFGCIFRFFGASEENILRLTTLRSRSHHFSPTCWLTVHFPPPASRRGNFNHKTLQIRLQSSVSYQFNKDFLLMYYCHLPGSHAVISERMDYTDEENTLAKLQGSLHSLFHNHWLICNVFKAETALLALRLHFSFLCFVVVFAFPSVIKK